MDNNIMYGLINFSLVAIVFLGVLAILFHVFCKKFKFNPKNIELYGLFLNLDTMSLIAIASVTIHYLFLVWCMISFNGLNIIYIALIFILIFISDIVLDEFIKIPLSIVMGVVDCLAIEIIYLIYRYLINESFSYMLMLLLGFVVLFIFLYYTYNLFRQINNIVVNHKSLRNKKYKI